MKRLFDFTVQVVYNGTVKVEAENIQEAEDKVRGIMKPCGVLHDSLLGEKENCEFDSYPAVHFLHHSEIPDGESWIPLSPPATPEEINTGRCSWCQHCTNEGCCLHGTDSLAAHCSNYKEEKHGT